MSKLRLTFLGAAGTVTGSKYLVETEKYKVLVDCGLFQGKKELRLRNWEKFPIEANSIDAVVLTHAHIDHIGYLPALVKQGFNRHIFATPATDEIARILLADSAELQEEEAAFAEKIGSSKHHPPKPLYNRADARETGKLFKTIPFGDYTEILPGVKILPRQAGHILGSSNITLECDGRRISFSGDVGRFAMPILKDPEPMELGDLLLCESTYGDRLHEGGDLKEEILKVIQETIARKAPLIIPAFALGRTQTLLYFLSELESLGRIPSLPVFVDSPMASDVTAIYRRYPENFDEEMRVAATRDNSPLFTSRTQLCRSTQQSKELNFLEGARIIIAGSGMCNGGRVLHHLMHHLPNPDATVMFVGYQSPGTRGEAIQSGASHIKIFGRQIPVCAHVKTVSGLSAHGDKGELIRWLKSCRGQPGITRIVHGEPAVAESFSQALQKEFTWKVGVAAHGEVVEL